MIAEILNNRNATTRFRIMVEIAASGPSIKQKSIAASLSVTPQAISDYIKQMEDEKLIESTGYSNYKISTKGVNWILSSLRELRSFVASVEAAVTNITVCAAVAECDIKQGQQVWLKMKDGVLIADCETGKGATGTARSGAKEGEDIDIADIRGLVELTRGKVTILQVHTIQKGGSKSVELEKVKDYICDGQIVGAIGIEALITLRRVNMEPRYFYGVTEAAIEAAQCGIAFTVVCTDDAIPGLIKKLQEKALDYRLVDLRTMEES